MESYPSHPRDATTDRTELLGTNYLSWADSKAVSSFASDFVWPAPERGDATAYSRMLANAVPPKMAQYLCELLERSGVFGLAAEQAGLRRRELAKSTEPELEGEVLQACAINAGSLANLEDLSEQLRTALASPIQEVAEEAAEDEHVSGGTPILSYKSKDKAVNAVLDRLRVRLAPHMLGLRVDLDGWSANQMSRLADMLIAKQETVFSADKWDMGYCQGFPFDIALQPGARPVADRPYRYSPKI